MRWWDGSARRGQNTKTTTGHPRSNTTQSSRHEAVLRQALHGATAGAVGEIQKENNRCSKLQVQNRRSSKSSGASGRPRLAAVSGDSCSEHTGVAECYRSVVRGDEHPVLVHIGVLPSLSDFASTRRTLNASPRNQGHNPGRAMCTMTVPSAWSRASRERERANCLLINPLVEFKELVLEQPGLVHAGIMGMSEVLTLRIDVFSSVFVVFFII